MIPSIKDVKDLSGKRVLLRAGLNVPVKDGVVLNDFRIRKSMDTIKYLINEGAQILIVSHIGRGKEDTLLPVYEYMKKEIDLVFTDRFDDVPTDKIVLFENLRKHEGELNNYEEFAKKLASLADIYVNDAFSVSHREHASIVGVPQYIPGYVGLLFMEEYKYLSKSLEPDHPSLFILGGAKFDIKEPLIRKALDHYDTIFVGGAIANDFFKAKGYEVGESKISSNLPKDLVGEERIILPVDVVIADRSVKNPDEVLASERIVDVGPETIRNLKDVIDNSKFILWNGPLGLTEEGFDEQTEELIKILAQRDATVVVGGGETVESVFKYEMQDAFTFLSTAGGAMIQFLTEGTLPGIKALT